MQNNVVIKTNIPIFVSYQIVIRLIWQYFAGASALIKKMSDIHKYRRFMRLLHI